ncbi:helix-turn-helix domain-containing protein [Schlesneria sp. T3-172]|uniref:helix-turn-helix domain-containing protein n=1 Tax=Schlesneria sphaerica TaxID=3373610 RepID=UPI0037C764E8
MLTPHYTPKEVAARFRCKVEKILAWIASRELIAIQAGSNQNGGKPRWLISPEALEDFERARTTVPAPKPVPRRRRNPAPVKSYF